MNKVIFRGEIKELNIKKTISIDKEFTLKIVTDEDITELQEAIANYNVLITIEK